MNNEMNTGLIASGGGTDFGAIASAWRSGQIPNVSEIVLFGTRIGAGCFMRADVHHVKSALVECADMSQVSGFNTKLRQELAKFNIGMLFLAGCVWEIDTRGLSVPVFNIHPANTHDHGGRHMYGLAPHLHVLEQIKDQIHREVGSSLEPWFTQICVHRVRSEAGIDGGEVIMSLNVPIPSDLIHDLVNGAEINMLAKALQQHVLRYEHLILPGAVNILAQMCLDARKTNPH